MELWHMEEDRRIIPVGGGSYDGADNPSTTDAVPTMTSNTTPSGEVTSSPPSFSSSWGAFDDGATNFVTKELPYYLQYRFDTQKLINKYTIKTVASSSGAPEDWTLQGSTNGVDYDVLHAVTGEVFVDNVVKTFTFTADSYYTYFKLVVTALGSTVTYKPINEMELIEQAV